MANPAPTINQINAFNATQGTIIDFNIIGGTELVRSNRIYIYDLSDNSLICTHLYVSTESIHELPPNTDSSIVYESGKSSADFVNGAQYYAQIQTFTDTAGTEGGSGLSVAKMFWCLVDPTLTITTIPSTISTTSYNVSATYDANTSVVSNIIQQYQFSLYSATGSLLQSSGVIVGSGTQQGTSTAYDISYNFTGLSVGSSYYVVVDVTTTQGMSVSTQSNTFTVSIETPTLGEATVVNNACDGYISVTSNLSSEYGGSASGEIATFVTDSVNDVSSLKVTLEPQQNSTPWIGADHDTTPYLNRAMPTQSNDYNRESGVIVGGTVAWNQLAQNGNFSDGKNYWSVTNGTVSASSGVLVYTLNSTPTSEYSHRIAQDAYSRTIVGHKYFIKAEIKPSINAEVTVAFTGTTQAKSAVIKPDANTWGESCALHVANTNSHHYLQVYEGSDYSSWSANDTISVRNFVCIDLTQMFGSTIADYVYSLEQSTSGSGIAWLKSYGFLTEDYIPYSQPTLQSVQATAHKTYDADDNVIGNYALDSSLTLRGIPKLDASNNLYYDGDTYASDGTVTRKYGVVDMGTLTWTAGTDATGQYFYSVGLTDAKSSEGTSAIANVVCPKYVASSSNAVGEKNIAISSGANPTVYIRDTSYSDAAAFKTAMSGVYLVYELATPTEETSTPYTNPQIVDPDGTEEYVTANSVPVGHDSTYSLVCPISGWDEVNVSMSPYEQTEKHTITGKNIYNAPNNQGNILVPCHIPKGDSFVVSARGGSPAIRYYDENKAQIDYWTSFPNTAPDGRKYRVITALPSKDVEYVEFYGAISDTTDFMVELGNTYTSYEPYGYHYTTTLPTTVYGGTVDLVSGELVIDRAMVDLGTLNWYTVQVAGHERAYSNVISGNKPSASTEVTSAVCSQYVPATNNQVYNHTSDGIFAVDDNGRVQIYDSRYISASGADFKTALSGHQLCYELATPQTIQLTPQEIRTILGTNNVWSEDGDVEITYNIPITNLLVKRQDVVDVSGTWLTLYSQPITQASDMDFTFIDFLNQYGKTYKYALVPLLTQQQSGVEVEVEGGYTVSDEVQSIFDGVFIADSTGSQKCKANVGYGDVDMNQAVGTITPIGAKYPVVITNSKNQYHNGSISGTIVPDDYYFNGNLSRIDMVNKRNELEQFLTNKRAKIIKDWNSNIWLVMMMDNITCTFNNEYGMGIVNFNANWIEVGDPTNQQDLQATGLIDVGGV